MLSFHVLPQNVFVFSTSLQPSRNRRDWWWRRWWWCILIHVCCVNECKTVIVRRHKNGNAYSTTTWSRGSFETTIYLLKLLCTNDDDGKGEKKYTLQPKPENINAFKDETCSWHRGSGNKRKWNTVGQNWGAHLKCTPFRYQSTRLQWERAKWFFLHSHLYYVL